MYTYSWQHFFLKESNNLTSGLARGRVCFFSELDLFIVLAVCLRYSLPKYYFYFIAINYKIKNLCLYIATNNDGNYILFRVLQTKIQKFKTKQKQEIKDVDLTKGEEKSQKLNEIF